MREFFRYYFLKVLLVLVLLQLVFFYWLEHRNHKPEATLDEISVYEGQSVKCLPIRNDTDKDEDELKIADISKPLHGTIKQDDDVLIYSIDKGYFGLDSFTYTVTDGKKESNAAYIRVTINENLKPNAENDYVLSYPSNKIPLVVLGNDNDKEGDSLFVTEITKPIYGSVSKEGNVLYYSCKNNSALQDSFHYIISDGFTNSDKATVRIEIKNINNPNYPWIAMDVGKPSIKGSTTIQGNKLIVKGSGDDIWNRADNFQFAYQIFEGDFEMITKAVSLENTNQWAKIGIMVREALTGPSKSVYMCLSSENGTNFQRRLNTGSGCNSDNQRGDSIAAPQWLKVIREGDKFTGYRSSDGIKWSEVGYETFSLSKVVYIGIGVTSHDDSKLCTAVADLRNTVIKKINN